MDGAEQRLVQALGKGWSHAPPNADYDCENADRRQIIEVRNSRGVRDLHAALMWLALVVDEQPSIERAYLIARFPKMSTHRIQTEWERVQRVLNPHVMTRLALIAIAGSDIAVLPDDDETRRLASLAQNAFEEPEKATQQPTVASSKFFEVWKALLRSWLAREGPLQIGELADRAGCSYPTVAKALDRLQDRREIERNKSRAVKLREFPKETLREVLVLADTLRRPSLFVDATGRESDPQLILRRLQSTKPPRVALGGVVAAWHYDPHFDLHGIPRLDVVMYEPVDLGWVRRVDPALQQAPQNEPAPVLVVRPLMRPEPDFTEVRDLELPIADPVETLLDLYELRLNEQAEELVRALRGGDK
jgi:DNA-binding Lrp family transcriptional regulator